MIGSRRLQLALLVTAGIVGPGLADYALTRAGYGALGTAVWVTGYLGMVLLVWYWWLRPLDLTGP